MESHTDISTADSHNWEERQVCYCAPGFCEMPRHCLGQILILNIPHMLREPIHWSLATLTTVLLVCLCVGQDINKPPFSFAVQPSLNFDGFS